tara:strand:- start:71 stop:688 length:618 start_codon:yes stop_codon:yes gene_type:complete
MKALRARLRSGIASKLILVAAMWGTSQNTVAHDLFDQWDADVTPILCLMAGESGLIYDEQYNSYEPGPVTVRVVIGRFHTGAENTLSRIKGLEIEPLFINLQVITSISSRSEDVTVTEIKVLLGDEAVSPILDSEREHDDLPLSYLGGNEANRFVQMLERADSPVVSVKLSNSNAIDVPISKTGFEVARSMMRTCINEAGKLAAN